MRSRVLTIGILLIGTLSGVTLLAGGGQGAVQRTVYITATDGRGYVSDLSAADLTVKDGSKERQIVRLEPSSDRVKVAVVLDELLVPDATIRQAMLRFIQRMRGSGDLALHLVGLRGETLVDYTSDFSPFVNAINALPARAQYPGNLVEALRAIAREQRRLEGRRAIVVIAPEIPQVSNVTAEGVFDELRDGGVVLHAATFVGWRTRGGTLEEAPATRLEGGDLTQIIERDRVLGDGPKRSGGLRVSSLRVEGVPSALDRIADDLLHQYRLTYLIPAGERSDGRVSFGARRRGLTLRGPGRLPEVGGR